MGRHEQVATDWCKCNTTEEEKFVKLKERERAGKIKNIAPYRNMKYIRKHYLEPKIVYLPLIFIRPLRGGAVDVVSWSIPGRTDEGTWR